MSTSTTVRALRADLAAVIRRASQGDRIVVTVSGRPTALVCALDDHAPDLDRLIAAGAVVPPRRTSTWRPPPPVAVWSGVRLDRALAELRG